MCIRPGRTFRVEDALPASRLCFWCNSFNSAGESPGSLEPGAIIRMVSSAGFEKLVNESGEGEELRFGFTLDEVDLSAHLSHDILTEIP